MVESFGRAYYSTLVCGYYTYNTGYRKQKEKLTYKFTDIITPEKGLVFSGNHLDLMISTDDYYCFKKMKTCILNL